MSAPGRPKREYRKAQPEGSPVNAVHAAARAAEAARQQRLLAALCGDAAATAAVLHGVSGAPAQATRALQAYRANARSNAERALTIAFPTVAALVGDETLALLARRHWSACPPTRGDLALWGDALPEALAADPALADEPYLADVARVDWAVHVAESAADLSPALDGLARLAHDDPAGLQLVLAPGAALVASQYPVVTLWQAHRGDAADRFAPVRAAFMAGAGETALIWRAGWRGTVDPVLPGDRLFMAALCRGESLAAALDGAAVEFDFSGWLAHAVTAGWLVGVTEHDGAPAA
ncbi:MAG: DNA-binding domain-containing protein [Rubrivivax sp.]